MLESGKQNSKKQTYQLWRNDNHPIELYHNEVINQKTEYIHNNPVAEGIVEKAEDYIYSSAKNSMGKEGLLTIEIL